MKNFKLLFIILAIAALLFTIVSLVNTGKYKDGVYNGIGEGKNGEIKVEVAVEKGKISAIKILEHKETPGLSDPILEKIPQEIIKAQSTEVSAIAGATVTSNGVIQAVQDAIKDAGK